METEIQWYNEMRDYLLDDEYDTQALYLKTRESPGMSDFIKERILYEGRELVKGGHLSKDKMLSKVKSYLATL